MVMEHSANTRTTMGIVAENSELSELLVLSVINSLPCSH